MKLRSAEIDLHSTKLQAERMKVDPFLSHLSEQVKNTKQK